MNPGPTANLNRGTPLAVCGTSLRGYGGHHPATVDGLPCTSPPYRHNASVLHQAPPRVALHALSETLLFFSLLSLSVPRSLGAF